MSNDQSNYRERVLRAAKTEHDQILIALKQFALDAFMRGDDRSALAYRVSAT